MLCTLGRLDRLRETGALDRFASSLTRFCERSMVLSTARKRFAAADSAEEGIPVRRIGPALVFDRLWEETGCREAVVGLAEGRRYGFDLERVVFFSVLHRLIRSGSDRQAHKWGSTQKIAGLDEPELQHLYRAMAWLGEPLLAAEQVGGIRTPRVVKDRIEERLFAGRRSLFSRLDLVFFDTTSMFFYGAGGSELGRRGHSKDKRPELRQMVLGMVLDESGTPVCTEMWPGNAADAKALVPVAERLSQRFGIGSVCLVADQGMVSRRTMEEIEGLGWRYVLGARMRTVKEIRERVLADPAALVPVALPKAVGKDRDQLAVKEVVIREATGGAERRYVVCRNEAQARRDRESRAEMLSGLAKKLRSGAKQLVANRGYARYLTAEGKGFRIDPEKARAEEQFDGMWVLRTNASLSAADTALRYKELWRVEQTFRMAKADLDTRPIFHQTDAAIRGHVFCSFLALVLRHQLFRRLRAAGVEAEWKDVLQDLDELCEGVIEQDGKRFVVRSAAKGITSRVFHSMGMALPPALRQEKVQEPTPG